MGNDDTARIVRESANCKSNQHSQESKFDASAHYYPSIQNSSIQHRDFLPDCWKHESNAESDVVCEKNCPQCHESYCNNHPGGACKSRPKRQSFQHIRTLWIFGHHGGFCSQRSQSAFIRVNPRRGSYRTPFGYTRILLASPVRRRSMALPKSFIEMRSVIAGCRSSLPAFKSAVI